MKGHIVRDVYKTGSVPAAPRIVCLRITMNKDITNADEIMAGRTVYRGGLVPSVKHTAFLTTMTTTGVTAARMTEVRPVLMDGLARIARYFVLPETTNEGITLATRKVTKCA